MSKFDWMDDALCREVGPELFVSEESHDSRHAKRVCERCTVINECLSWAMENPDMHGVLGGTTPRERRDMRGWKRGQRRTA